MTKKLYSIKDNVSGLYNPPFVAINKGDAYRMLSNLVNNKESSISQHPDDYSLYCLGEWNETDGTVIIGNGMYHQPEFLANANDFVRQVA